MVTLTFTTLVPSTIAICLKYPADPSFWGKMMKYWLPSGVNNGGVD